MIEIGRRILKNREIFWRSWAIGLVFAGHCYMRSILDGFSFWKLADFGVCLLNPNGSIFVYTVGGGLRMIRR